MGVETILRASRLTATPAMTDDNQLSFNLPSVSRKKVTAAFDGGRLSSDSGVMLLALADRRRAVADTLAALIADHRDPSHRAHPPALAQHTHITIRGDGHYGREEMMRWCENYGIDYIFGLSGNVALDRLVEAAADDIRVRRAVHQAEVLRGFAETRYAAKS